MSPHKPVTRIQVLASRNFSGELLAAFSIRLSAQLIRRYAPAQVPPEAIADAVAKFSHWLQVSCEATRPAE
jgi:hypothetical protein